MGTAKDSEITRRKIIEAAGELFAEKGLTGVTVRDIVAKADTNLGALNYHFRSKEALYQEIVRDVCRENSLTENEVRIISRMKPEKALKTLISEMVKLARSNENTFWKSALLTRECWDPNSFMFDEVMDNFMDPLISVFSDIVANVTGKNSGDQDVRLAVVSLFSVVEFIQYRTFTEKTVPGFYERFSNEKDLTERLYKITIAAAGK